MNPMTKNRFTAKLAISLVVVLTLVVGVPASALAQTPEDPIIDDGVFELPPYPPILLPRERKLMLLRKARSSRIQTSASAPTGS